MKNSESKYRLCWKSLITGKSGYGITLYSYDEAETMCNYMNDLYKDSSIIYWFELSFDEAKDQ